MNFVPIILAALCAFVLTFNLGVLLFSGFDFINALAVVMNAVALIILVPQISRS